MKKDHYYMQLAKTAASQSKDDHTKVGACFVKDGRVLSLGWNGAPRKFDDRLVPNNRNTSLPLKEQKYPYVVHAEMNGILNYGGSIQDFKGSSLYVTVSPCYDCAKMLAQLEIREVVYGIEYNRKESADMARYMLESCGVEVREYEACD